MKQKDKDKASLPGIGFSEKEMCGGHWKAQKQRILLECCSPGCRSFVLGCLIQFCKVKQGVRSKTETKLTKIEHQQALFKGIPNICLCVSLSFVTAVDENSDVCWGKSMQAASSPWSERSFYSSHSLRRNWVTIPNPLSNYLYCSRYHAVFPWLTWKSVLYYHHG